MTYTFSVSQVELARDCQAKWGFRYLEGIKLPPHPSALKGIELHKVAEAYLRDGTPPPDNEIGRIFRVGIELLPEPGLVLVEDEVYQSTPSADWVMRRDFTRGDKTTGQAMVGDHKTTGNLEADYLLDEQTIRANPQACLYAFPYFEEGYSGVEARWVYYRTRGSPKAKAVVADLDEALVRDVVAQLDEDTIPLSRLIRERPPVSDLEKNYSSCSKYGGCPHRGVRCKVSTAQLFASRKGNNNMSSILERIKALKAEKEKAASASERSPEPSNPAQSSEGTAPSNPSGDLSDADAAKAAKDYLESQGRTVAAGFVNPPESAGKPALAEPPPDENEADAEADHATERLPAPEAGAAAAEPTEPYELPEGGRKKRGRPKKLSPEERAAVVAQATQHANQLDAQRAAGAPVPTSLHPGSDQAAVNLKPHADACLAALGLSGHGAGLCAPIADSTRPVLYLDCLPPWPHVSAYALFAAARERLQRAGVEQDYRLVEFGKGRGLLAEALREVLAEQKPAAIVAESRSPEVADCITTLAEYVGEGRIVRGLR